MHTFWKVAFDFTPEVNAGMYLAGYDLTEVPLTNIKQIPQETKQKHPQWEYSYEIDVRAEGPHFNEVATRHLFQGMMLEQAQLSGWLPRMLGIQADVKSYFTHQGNHGYYAEVVATTDLQMTMIDLLAKCFPSRSDDIFLLSREGRSSGQIIFYRWTGRGFKVCFPMVGISGLKPDRICRCRLTREGDRADQVEVRQVIHLENYKPLVASIWKAHLADLLHRCLISSGTYGIALSYTAVLNLGMGQGNIRPEFNLGASDLGQLLLMNRVPLNEISCITGIPGDEILYGEDEFSG